MAALVSGTFLQGENQINFDSVSTGSYLNCYPNITVKIGSTEGASDVGTIRLRMITGSYAVFAENSVVWRNNYFLTFIDFVDVNPVFPKIIKDPNQTDNVIFYKDDDIPYSNQNTIYGTFPCAGPHRAALLETGTASIFYSSTGSYNVKGDSLTFNWAFEGGTPTGSTLRDPGNVSYVSCGHYRTRLIITSSSGAVDTTYRYVSIYDRPENGTCTPVLKWEMGDLSGSRSEGGYIVHMKSFDNLSDIEPNALVVIFQDNWFGGTKTSIGGNANNNSSIFFVGYILKDSITFNYKEGYAEYDVGNISILMKDTEGFSVSCESVVTASTWFQLDNMNVTKAMYHYLRWHSTVLNVADFQYTGDDRLVQYFDSDRESLWDAIDNFVREGLIGELVSDRQGKIWAEISPPGYQNPFASIRSGGVAGSVQKQDWMGEPNITERRTAEQSFIEMGGIVYQGPQTNQFTAILSNAPSLTPLYRGKSESPYQGLILNSQLQLNQLSGNYLADKNSPFPVVGMSINGNYQYMDIAPQEKFTFDITASDTKIGESLIGLWYRPLSMNWRYNNTNGTLTPDMEFQQIVTGTAGETLIIPITPPDNFGYGFPSLDLPPLFSFVTPPAQEQIGRVVLCIDNNFGFVYTLDIDASSPTWAINNAGIDSDDTERGLFTFFIAPNGSAWAAYSKPNDAALYYAPTVDSPWTKLIDDAFLQAAYPSTLDWNIQGIGFNSEENEEIVIIMGGSNDLDTHQANFWIGDHSGFTRKASISNFFIGAGDARGNLTYNPVTTKWTATGRVEAGITDRAGFAIFNSDGSTLEYVTNFSEDTTPIPSIRAIDTGWLYIFNLGIGADAGKNMASSLNDGRTYVNSNEDLAIDSFFPFYKHACDPSGQFLLGVWSTGKKGRSSDYGNTWVAIPNLPPGNEYSFAYMGGEGLSTQWLAVRGVVRYSPNWGNTWINKEGNIAQLLLPAPDLRGIAVNIGRRSV